MRYQVDTKNAYLLEKTLREMFQDCGEPQYPVVYLRIARPKMSKELVVTERFMGRRLAVIGAAGGIGAYISESLHRQGATVYAIDLRKPDGLDGAIATFEADVNSEKSIVALVTELYSMGDAPIELVNSAGVVENNVAADEMPMSEFDRVMGVNLRGVFLACRDFGRELLARGGGAIVNVASMSGTHVVNFPQKQSVYNTSKAGVAALTRSLAVEWGGRGVRVNCVSPGYVDTPLNALKKEMHEQWIAETILGRFATLAEVSGAVEYLLSDEAAYCCGTELLIDGGSSLR
jgi:NAD(P)-dependent dehydrogenase (short-subunit alcohol dehydrogenase family)